MLRTGLWLAPFVAIVALSGCSSSDAKAPPAKGDAAPAAGAASVAASTTPASGSASAALASAAQKNDTISARADHGRILGDSNAKVWVIMASDFQCPYCKAWHDASFKKILDTYVNTGRVRLAYLNMPLSIHPNAVPAAEAAMCASVQNKFWPMHEALFATQKDWESLPKPDSAFEALASKQNLDMAAWRTCFNEHLTIPLIQADHDRAVAAHVNSTPTFFVGNQVMPGADADVPGAIEAALKAAGVSKKPPTD